MNITNENCMDLMSRYRDKHFDLAICDPPYGIGNFNIKNNLDKFGNRVKGNGLPVTWNGAIPCANYFIELKRVSKNQIIWGANYYNCFEKGGAIIWDKGKRQELFSQCEIASVSFQQKVDYIFINWQSGFYRKKVGENTIHPCQKPISLYRWLLRNYAKKGDKILDTHMGSGSIAIACHYEGYDLTACELDKDYYDAAMKRIKTETQQIEMFQD